MWCEWAQSCREKYNERDQSRTWRGFRRNGFTGGSIIQLARDNGYVGHRNGRSWHKVKADLRAQGYEPKAVYPYLDANGFLIGEKVRFEHPNPKPDQHRKTFR